MLSEKQQEAVGHVLGPCLCLAGPGSGKTKVLTERLAHLISEEGVRPENILVLTYSRAAAKEMKERFEALIGRGLPVAFGTFHSVFFGILRREYGSSCPQLMNAKQKESLLAEAAGLCGLEGDAGGKVLALVEEGSYIKNTLCPPQSYPSTLVEEDVRTRFLEAYEARKRSCGLWDLDDLLVQTRELFLRSPAALRRWQERFAFLLVDEAQDINALQFEIVRLLALPQNNLFLVGDDDQSIYGFRGAAPEVLLHFPSAYPNGRRIVLRENFRCASAIVDAAQTLIGHNTARLPKETRAAAKRRGWILYEETKDETDESLRAAELLEKWRREVGAEKIAVLYRNRRSAFALAERCCGRGIRICFRGAAANPYEQEAARDIVAYLRLASGGLQRGDMLRVMNRPWRGVSRASIESGPLTFERWRLYYASQPDIRRQIETFERDLRFLSTLSGTAALLYIRKKIGYEGYLRQEREEERWQPALEMMETLAAGAPSVRCLLERWQEGRDFWERHKKNAAAENDGGISFLTLHGAKGLEFERVLILDCNEGSLPSEKAVTKEQIEEERRLFYVGLTRAKEGVCLFFCGGGGDKKSGPSRFLAEMRKAKEQTT